MEFIGKNTDCYIKKEGFNSVSHKHAIFNSLTFRLINVPFIYRGIQQGIQENHWNCGTEWLPKTNHRQEDWQIQEKKDS